jgi:hypothetical protein
MTGRRGRGWWACKAAPAADRDSHSMERHRMRTTTTDPPGLEESRVRCKSHARFGKRLRGNGPVEKPEPRPGPTSPAAPGGSTQLAEICRWLRHVGNGSDSLAADIRLLTQAAA